MRAENVFISNGAGTRLPGKWHYPEKPSTKGVIVCHGFTGDKEAGLIVEACNALARAGFNALRFDFTGNGASLGEAADGTYSREVKDVIAVARWWEKKGIQKWGLAGHSMGSAVCVLASLKLKGAKAVVCLASVAHPKKAVERLGGWALKEALQKGFVWGVTPWGVRVRFTRAFLEDALNQDVLNVAAHMNAALLCVHGKEDDTRHHSESQDLVRACTSKYKKAVVLANADHEFSRPVDRKAVIRESIDWFKKHVK